MSRVAALERRHQEQEAEKSTIEAYYEARLAEMQAQVGKHGVLAAGGVASPN
jgi:hypothetical protein